MDDIEQEVMKELYEEIFEDLDPLYVLPCLKRFLPWEFCEQLRNTEPLSQRTAMFLDRAVNELSMENFLHVLSYQNAYVHLITRIEEKLTEKSDDVVYHPIKIKIFTKHRKEMVEFRHQFKKIYSLTGKQSSFDIEVNRVVKLWKDKIFVRSLEVSDRQKLADKYFFVRDAQCENMRLKYETSLDKTDVLTEIINIAPHTTNPTLTTMMYLARKGSAMIMADPKTHAEAYIDFIETAVQNSEQVPACRETGLVFYIKYNFLCLKYEENLNTELKSDLHKIAGKAIDHFCREYEKVSVDFKNIFAIKLSHLHLGIGVLGTPIHDAIITEEDIEHAKHRLENIKVDDLSNRWKWGFYIAQSKIHILENDLKVALNYAEVAYHHAVKGNFKNEIMGTKEMLEFIRLELGEKQDCSDTNMLKIILGCRHIHSKLVQLLLVLFVTVIILFFLFVFWQLNFEI